MKAITCPSCGGTIAIKAQGYSVSVACQYCGSMLDVAQPDVKLIAEYHRAVAALDLPLGSRGAIFGVEWEAIGWLERRAQGYVWQEYLLFNPYAGYRWLVASGGEWQFGQMLTGVPEALGWDAYGWAGRRFAREDESATIETTRVLGEFYWRVRAGDTVKAESYASGEGQTLSMEATGEEVQWTHLVPVPQGWIDAFTRPQGPDLARPTPQRPAPAPEKAGFASWWRDAGATPTDLFTMTLVALIAAFAAMLLLLAFGASTASLSAKAQVPVDSGSVRFTVGTLKISRAQQYVTVTVNAESFVNKWVDLDYALVNKATQQGMPASASVEYYTGHDSDGDWAEGDHSATTHFAQVPAGDYDLVVEAQAHNWSADGASSQQPADNPWGIGGVAASPAPAETVAIAVLLEAGGVPWGLLWLAVLLLALPIVALFFYRRSMTA